MSLESPNLVTFRIDALVPDILSRVLDYLTAFELHQLLLCGDRHLTLKLYLPGVTKLWSFGHRHLDIAPRLAKQFKWLDTLQVRTNLYNMLHLMASDKSGESWWPVLRKMQLSEKSSLFVSETQVAVNFGVTVPKLEYFDCKTNAWNWESVRFPDTLLTLSIVQLRTQHEYSNQYLTLPPNLTSLRLSAYRSFISPSASVSFTHGVPASLTDLGSLWMVHIKQMEELTSEQLLTAFPNLTALSIRSNHWTRQLIQGLPKLRKLQIYAFIGNNIGIPWDSLASTQIETLEVIWLGENSEKLFRYLPPTLTDFKVTLLTDLPSKQKFNHLPTNLTQLCLAGNFENLFSSRLPPNLTNLRLNCRNLNVPGSQIAKLPRGIKSIDLTLFQLPITTYLQDLPPTLTELKLPNVGSDNASHLASIFNKLPATLRIFHFHSGTSLPISALERLPKTLSQLWIEGHAVISNDHIAVLPPRLEVLICGLTSGKSTTAEGLSKLPSSITQLFIWHWSKHLGDEGIAALPRGITTLALMKAGKLTVHYSHHLPPSLTKLHTSHEFAVEEPFLKGLPMSIRDLLLLSRDTLADFNVLKRFPHLGILYARKWRFIPENNVPTDIYHRPPIHLDHSITAIRRFRMTLMEKALEHYF